MEEYDYGIGRTQFRVEISALIQRRLVGLINDIDPHEGEPTAEELAETFRKEIAKIGIDASELVFVRDMVKESTNKCGEPVKLPLKEIEVKLPSGKSWNIQVRDRRNEDTACAAVVAGPTTLRPS